MRLQEDRQVGTKGFMVSPPAPDASRSLPDFSELDLQGKVLPEGVELGDIKAFQVLYREHCEVGQPARWARVREGHTAPNLPEHPASPIGHR